MPVLPVSDTIYQSADGTVLNRLLDRNTLFAGQAPEAFFLRQYWSINNSVSLAELNQFKGTSEIAYQFGIRVRLIHGEDSNFKITTSQDFDRFCMLCSQHNNRQ